MMIKRLKAFKVSDFKLAFAIGMVGYVFNNLLIKRSVEAEWYMWLTANTMSAVTHILLIFVLVKVARKIDSII
ncbi:hypothetical protein MHI17_31045 [Bacillus sp. FSL L8-0098]|uniref:hypothetical protein n=2 Tax=unclassified Bacillus (in: firmicutes) TaxID=185979 RepID=UPI0030F9F1D1